MLRVTLACYAFFRGVTSGFLCRANVTLLPGCYPCFSGSVTRYCLAGFFAIRVAKRFCLCQFALLFARDSCCTLLFLPWLQCKVLYQLVLYLRARTEQPPSQLRPWHKSKVLYQLVLYLRARTEQLTSQLRPWHQCKVLTNWFSTCARELIRYPLSFDRGTKAKCSTNRRAPCLQTARCLYWSKLGGKGGAAGAPRPTCLHQDICLASTTYIYPIAHRPSVLNSQSSPYEKTTILTSCCTTVH
jgi:hypothetical protein